VFIHVVNTPAISVAAPLSMRIIFYLLFLPLSDSGWLLTIGSCFDLHLHCLLSSWGVCQIFLNVTERANADDGMVDGIAIQRTSHLLKMFTLQLSLYSNICSLQLTFRSLPLSDIAEMRLSKFIFYSIPLMEPLASMLICWFVPFMCSMNF
jgi:hypothetical protein